MGELVVSVSEYTEVSRNVYIKQKMISSILQFICGMRREAGNLLTPAFGWKGSVRNFIWDFGKNRLNSNSFLSVRSFSDRYFVVKHFDDQLGRNALYENGIESPFGIRPVIPMSNGRYLVASWYYDGGSDGYEEGMANEKAVIQYFQEEPLLNNSCC